jgi:hypothetical protein
MLSLWAQQQPSSGWDPSWWPTHSPESFLNLIGYMLMVVGAVVLLGGAAMLMRRLVRFLRPVRVFMAVARAVGLSYPECWWLWRVARAQQLINPLTLLMSPETLRFHVEEYAGRSRGAGRLRHRLEAIGRRLFESPDRASG